MTTETKVKTKEAKDRAEYKRLTKKLLFTLDLTRKELDRYMALRVTFG